MLRKLSTHCFLLLMLASAIAAQISAQTCTPVAPDLVSWYSGDSNALDSRSRNNATLNGNAFAAGKVGQGFDLNNIAGITAADNAAFNQQKFTIEGWATAAAFGCPPGPVDNCAQFIASKSGTNAQSGFELGTRQAGTIRFSLNGGAGGADLTTANNIADGNFHHVAASYDGATMIIYIDGTVAAQTSVATTINYPANQPFFIGSRGFQAGATIPYNGLIDELGFYSRALSAPEIAAIAKAGSGGKCKPTATLAPSGQVAWLAGDGDAGDVSGNNNNGVLQNGAGFAVGKVGQGFNFTNFNQNQTVEIPDSASLDLTNAVTLEAWVAPSNVGSGGNNSSIITKGDLGVNSNQPYSLLFDSAGNVYMRVGNNAAVDQVGNTFLLPLNAFSHVVGTYDGSVIKIYVNGVLTNSQISSIGAMRTNNLPVRIGGNGYGDYAGKIDEVSIYNCALTDAEVQSIFNAGIAGKLKQNATVDRNSLVSLYRAENNANDALGTNNGTLEGVTFAAGKFGMAFNFTAQSQSVSIPNNPTLFPSTALSVEAWVNPTTYSGCAAQYRIFHTVRTDLRGYATLIDCPSRTLRLLLFDPSGTADTVVSNATIPAGVFTHFATTWDGSNLRLYINGVLDNTAATTISSIGTSSDPVRIGNQFNFGFIGQIDEPALYNRALTAAEVRANYEAGNALSTVVGDARITFPNVTTGGTTQQIPLDVSVLPPLPAGSTFTGLAYDIATSASFTGMPTVCFNLPALSPAQFAGLGVLHLEAGNWVDRAFSKNAATRTICARASSLSPFAIARTLNPTAASVTIGGRVFASQKRGLVNASVVLTDANGESRTARTNSFGYYRFDDVSAGQTIVVDVVSKRFSFLPRVISVTEVCEDVDFTALTAP